MASLVEANNQEFETMMPQLYMNNNPNNNNLSKKSKPQYLQQWLYTLP